MSYTVDNTLYVRSEYVDVALRKTRGSRESTFLMFPNNFLKANPDKCNLILSTDEPFSINIDNEVIKKSLSFLWFNHSLIIIL